MQPAITSLVEFGLASAGASTLTFDKSMILRQSLPWIWIAAPAAFISYLAVHIAQAISFFGHVPVYLVDKDQWFHDVHFFFESFSIVAYLISPLLFILWPIALFFSVFRYHGSHKARFYCAAFSIAVAYYLLFLSDLTGFIVWYID
jgi:hypothetical protein